MGMLGGKNSKKNMSSSQLQKILEISCLKCYSKFNTNIQNRPILIGECHHIYCKTCVEGFIFPQGSNDQISQCPQCLKTVFSRNKREQKLLLKVLSIMQNEEFTPTKNSIDELQKQLALKLFALQQLQCPKCCDYFNDEQKKPVITCRNQHMLCEKCLRQSGRGYKICRTCKQQVFPEQKCHVNKLVKSICLFLTKTLFTTRLIFDINTGNEIILTIDNSVTVKDIFHTLQFGDIISKKLQITLCKFYIETPVAYDLVKKEVKFTDRIDSITNRETVKLILECDHLAYKEGPVTQSSKIMEQLPINICHYQEPDNFRFENGKQQEYSQIFGGTFQVSQSKLVKQKQFQKKDIFDKDYEISPSKQNPYGRTLLQKEQSQLKDKTKIDELGSVIKSKLSKQKQSFLSNIYPSIIKRTKIRASRIPERKEMAAGTQIELESMFKLCTNHQQNERNQIFQKFIATHELEDEDQQVFCLMTEKIMNQPFTKLQCQESAKIQKQLQTKIKQGDLLSIIMQLLKQELQDTLVKVNYTAKSTLRSKLTLKLLTSHFMSDRIMLKQTLDEDEQWNFQKIYDNDEQLHKFIDKQKIRLNNTLGQNPQNVVFHSISKGSIILQYSINQPNELIDNLKKNLNRNIQIHPYFTQLQLCFQDFDAKGNIKFKQQKKDIQFRGNWPYYQPIKCNRYGIAVSGQFDNGDNTWLKMKNVPGQWVVGFHGVKSPNAIYKEKINVIQNILSGLHRLQKDLLIKIQNTRQKYESNDCANMQCKVGQGIYLTPHFRETFRYTSPYMVGNQTYRLVFQCRLNQNQIRIVKKREQYWVVNKSSAIRPYGIILLKQQVCKTYPTPIAQFGEIFTYQKYKQKIIKGKQADELKNKIIAVNPSVKTSKIQNKISKTTQ